MNLKIFLGITLLIVATHQLELECNFERAGWDDVIGPAHACRVLNLNLTKPKTVITSLRGRHPAGETNDNINTFLVFEQICEYFPVGIEKHFRSLNGIAIQKSGLKKITKTDLKPFADLKSISLFGNELNSLEKNLFIYNPKLKLISVFNNHLIHISGSIFDGINRLERAYFSTNLCVNEDVEGLDKIEQLKYKFIKDCPETYEMIEKADIEDELKKLKESFNAVSTTFVRTRKKLQQSEETYKFYASQKIDGSCSDLNIAWKNCESEKLSFLELIQEMEIVEIVCETVKFSNRNDANQCKAVGLKILKQNFKVVNVKSLERTLINTEAIIELIFNNQQTIFMPLNINNFFSKLTKLTVTNSQLISVSEEVFKGLHDLIEINFSSNQLVEIKSSDFNHFVKLVKLDLSHNRIEIIESSAFSSLSSLIELRLNDNFLMKLDSKMFMSSKQLKLLSLQNNQISQVASNFLDYCSKHLEIFNLRDNECIDLKFPTATLIEIRNQFVTNCTIQSNFECRFHSIEQYSCHAVNVLIESQNVKIARVVGDHESNKANSHVTEIKICNQTMEFVPQNLGKLLPNLKRVCIEGSKLKEIEKRNFEGFESITHLTIKQNNLIQISSGTLDDLIHLELLDFSFNSIETLDELAFVKLTHLKTINFNNNKLTIIKSEMISSQNVIERFLFNHNELRSINPNLIRLLKVAKFINFEANNCIDSKYDEAAHDNKKIMELFGEISFRCFEA